MLTNRLTAHIAPYVALALLLPLLVIPQVIGTSETAQADQFKTQAGPPTLSPITLTENDGDVFTSMQPANSNSTDRYNLSLSAAFPGGHDSLQGITMCWYLLDFEDCNDTAKIEAEPEIVFKATHSVTRDEEEEVTSETFRVIGDNNYDVNLDGFKSSTSVLREAAESVNVDITFTFKVSNAMRASSNWKVYVEVEDDQAQTAAVQREGIRVEYFAAMTLERQGVDFGGVEKGGVSVVDDIDTGNYTANAQSRFFIDADNFTSGGITLPIRASGARVANQVEIRCDRDSSYGEGGDDSDPQLVTFEPTQFGNSISPSSETPEDAPNHSCAVSFPKGNASNPNLRYTNTFTLAISASPVTAPQNLVVTADSVENPVTQRKLTFDPPQLVIDGQATIESYRIEVVSFSADANRDVTEQVIRVPLSLLEQGELGYDSSDTDRLDLSTVISGLRASTDYTFVVEASTTKGSGSTSSTSTTASSNLFEFSQVTFTPGGNTGRTGPNINQVLSGIASPDDFTTIEQDGYLAVNNGIIEWTVPEDGSYEITANGASGGTQIYGERFNRGNYDSYGASVAGTFNLVKDDKLYIVVGQRGGDTKYSNAWEGDRAAPGGGGGSFVYQDLNTLLLAAGGGAGGTKENYSSVNASTGTKAYDSQSGADGGSSGNGGGINVGGSSYWAGGGAGWLTDGTAGLTYSLYNRTAGSYADGGQAVRNGAEGGARYNDGTDSGGDGGFGGGGGGGSDNMGTGGGGGYSGGGGGNQDGGRNNGGGGGGSFVNTALNQASDSKSLRDVVAHGSVTIKLVE